jgi:glycosyltransferase involved in cell wall biosynthesis
MNILYHTHQYNKKFQIYEAVAQEISFLRKHFQGPVIQIDKEGLFYDRLPGWLVKRKIARLEKDVDLNHIYYPALINKPYFRFLKKPIIYSIVAPQNESGIMNHELRSKISALSKKVSKIVVSDRRDVELLKKYGIESATAILPGIDLSKFTISYGIASLVRPKSDLLAMTLLTASPPWRKHQLEDKGINLLLDLVEDKSCAFKIYITFLWRNCLYNQMKRIIKKRHLQNVCQVINKIVDPNQELAKVHGTIAIFPNPQTAKAYPHSLIESLATGKPVIISKNIYMSDLVEKENCGVVVEPNLESLKKGVDKFIQNYDLYQSNCRSVAEKYFSQKRLLEDYERIYKNVVK